MQEPQQQQQQQYYSSQPNYSSSSSSSSQDETTALLLFVLGFFFGHIIIWGICFIMYKSSPSDKARLWAKVSLVMVIIYLGLAVLSTVLAIVAAILYGIAIAIIAAKNRT